MYLPYLHKKFTIEHCLQIFIAVALGLLLSRLLLRYAPNVSQFDRVYQKTLNISVQPLEDYIEHTPWYFMVYPGAWRQSVHG